MKTLILLIVSLSVPSAFALELPYFEQGDLTPYWQQDPGAAQRMPAAIGAFSAVDQNGAAVTEKNFAGKVSLVNFFFSQCGNTCPRMMSSINRFQKNLKSAGLTRKVSIYSFSVTPEHDTPEVLRQYIQAHGFDMTSWEILTGKREEIFRVGKNMLKADRSVGAQKSESSFIHSENVYLLDASGKLRGIYDSASSAQMTALAQDLPQLTR